MFLMTNVWKWLTFTSSGSFGSNPWMASLLSTHRFCIYLAQEHTIARFYLEECSWNKDVLSIW